MECRTWDSVASQDRVVRVLVACEESGAVRDSFISMGHDAISCDLQETRSPGPHYKGDVRDILYDGWDMVIAHPVCTYICNSGVCHLWNDDGSKNAERWECLEEACEFFRLFVDLDCDKKAIENPIPHKYALDLIGVKYTQIIQPWMFGHTEQKATCLWLYGLDKLIPTNDVYREMMSLPDNQRQRLHYLPPGPERAKLRSETFTGIAGAMAEQWGNPKQGLLYA